jgi:hypothetical protein
LLRPERSLLRLERSVQSRDMGDVLLGTLLEVGHDRFPVARLDHDFRGEDESQGGELGAGGIDASAEHGARVWRLHVQVARADARAASPFRSAMSAQRLWSCCSGGLSSATTGRARADRARERRRCEERADERGEDRGHPPRRLPMFAKLRQE